MSVDLRGFIYPLTAILQQREWQLDIALSKVTETKKILQEQRTLLEEMEAQYNQAVADMRNAQVRQLNPYSIRSDIQFLRNFQEKLKSIKDAIIETEAQLCERLAIVTRAQTKLEVTVAHRDRLTQEYISTEQTKQAFEIDSDWISRKQWQRNKQDSTEEKVT